MKIRLGYACISNIIETTSSKTTTLTYYKKLDSENLITLCNMHHKMAEDNKISREELQEIVARKYRTPQA